MLNFLIFFFLMIMLMIIFVKNTLMFGLSMIIYTILISLITGMYYYSFWYSYMLFLTFIGGLLIMFIYMTTLIFNNMIKFDMNIYLYINFIIIIIMFIMMINYINKFNFFLNKDSQNIMNFKNEFLNITKFYNNNNFLLLLFLINYLFIVLLILMKISNINMGTLRFKK